VLQIGLRSDDPERDAHRAEPTAVRDDSGLAPIASVLRDLIDGKQRDFPYPLDISRGSPFQQTVWTALLDIPYGTTVTYGELAARIGKPKAARAVGQAVGANPLPVVVPCHRVLASGGALGGFSGGLEIKRHLLRVEGISFRE
jgi:O-6-methylguanine DNA methyltransferase